MMNWFWIVLITLGFELILLIFVYWFTEVRPTSRQKMYLLKYEDKNVNPMGRSTCDCFIRGIASFLDEDWYEVFDTFSEKGKDLGLISNSTTLAKKILEDWDNIEHTIINEKVKLGNYAPLKSGEYFALVKWGNGQHGVYIKDGVLYDTKDCRNHIVTDYYQKIEEES